MKRYTIPKMKLFILRMAGIASLLASVLLLDGWIQGDLPMGMALLLLPATALLSLRLLQAGLRRHRSFRRSVSSRRPVVASAAVPGRAAHTAQLRVYINPRDPNGPRAA